MAFTAPQAFELLQQAAQRQRLSHALLLAGPRGSGKERLAASLIASLQPPPPSDQGALFDEPPAEPSSLLTHTLAEVEGPYVHVVRPQSKSRRIIIGEDREEVGSMRWLEHKFQQTAPTGTWKVGVLLHAERCTEQAENAFLKTLEEPPAQSLLLLLTTAPQNLLPTIRSRCVRLDLYHPEQEAPALPPELLESLLACSAQHFRSLPHALLLKNTFATHLDEQKALLEEEEELAHREEIKNYRDRTEGTWLARQKEIHQAAARARYLEARASLLDALELWLGDHLRHLAGGTSLSFPRQGPAIAQAIEPLTPPDLLRRLDAFCQLRSTLETNASEALALEVGFMESFGPLP